MDQSPDVLVVDDEEADVSIVRAVMESQAEDLRIRDFRDSAELVAALEDAESSVPDLVLLDLNLPGWSGKQLLQRIRSSPRWSTTVVLVLSGSDLERDVLDCYRLGANAYVIKPADLDGYRKAFGSIVSFWLGTARRASPEAAS